MMLPIIIALDFSCEQDAFKLLERCDPKRCRVKIGKGMFTRFGHEFLRKVHAFGFDVFLDLKFHDIPNTVYDACRAAVDLGVWMINVHALGGIDMMLKAKEATLDTSTKLIAVTLLTSMNEADLKPLGFQGGLSDLVLGLSSLAHQCELEGVVASAHEAKIIKAKEGELFKIIAPGIRLSSDLVQDQKRIMTPKKALVEGVDYLVIGRSITQAKDPMEKLNEIALDINA